MTTIKELKELDAKATKGPWYGFYASFSREKMVAFSVISNDESGSNKATKADYEFVIASRNALPYLIRVIELAEEALLGAESVIGNMKGNEFEYTKIRQALSEIRKLKGK